MGLIETLNKPVEIEIEGKKFEIRQFTLDDFAEFERMIREERINSAIKVANSLPLTEKNAIIREAMTSPIDVFQEIESIRGTKFVIKRAVKCKEPISEDEMFRLLVSFGLNRVLEIMFPRIGDEANTGDVPLK